MPQLNIRVQNPRGTEFRQQKRSGKRVAEVRTGAGAAGKEAGDAEVPAKRQRRHARPKKSQAERRRESMSRILDCAEALFAVKGYNGVTLNEVAKKADVDTALMRYYFGDKQKLFNAVFSRRGPIINELRLKAMAEYREKAGDDFGLEGIIDAFTRPAFEKMATDDGWRNYMSIVSYVNSSRGYLHTLMSKTFDAVSHELLSDMRRIFPDADEHEIYWSYHFLTGAFTFSLGQTGRVDTLSNGLCKSDDVLAIAERLPLTISAGIRELCQGRTRGQQKKGSS